MIYKVIAALLERDICPIVLRLLLFMHTNQSLRVKWGNILSDQFSVMSGVRQGGMLSPILFCCSNEWVVREAAADWSWLPHW